MKNFKIKSIFFSLMAIVMVTVFLSSCEKENIENKSEIEQNDFIKGDYILMPYGFDNLSQKEQDDYFENLNKEDYELLNENHRIGSYLMSIEKLESTTELMEIGMLLTEIELSSILNNEELINFTNYSYNSLTSRGVCWSWNLYKRATHSCYCLEPGWCCEKLFYKRTCIGWGKYTEYMSVNACH